MDLDVNEIRDYINRAPPRNAFVDGRMVWYTSIRLKWLYEIASGSINDRINRRAGVVDSYEPWKSNPVYKSCQRHHFNEWRKKGVVLVNRRN